MAKYITKQKIGLTTFNMKFYLILALFFPLLFVIGIYSMLHIFVTGNDFTNTKFVQKLISPIINQENKLKKKKK